MTLPRSRTELIRYIERRHKRFDKAIAGVPEENFRDVLVVVSESHTRISVRTILEDLITWNTLLRKLTAASEDGRCPVMPASEAILQRAKALSRSLLPGLRGLGLPALRDRLQDTQGQIIDTMRSRSDTDLFHPSVPHMHTVGRLVQFSTAGAYDEALSRLRWWQRYI